MCLKRCNKLSFISTTIMANENKADRLHLLDEIKLVFTSIFDNDKTKKTSNESETHEEIGGSQIPLQWQCSRPPTIHCLLPALYVYYPIIWAAIESSALFSWTLIIQQRNIHWRIESLGPTWDWLRCSLSYIWCKLNIIMQLNGNRLQCNEFRKSAAM